MTLSFTLPTRPSLTRLLGLHKQLLRTQHAGLPSSPRHCQVTLRSSLFPEGQEDCAPFALISCVGDPCRP